VKNGVKILSGVRNLRLVDYIRRRRMSNVEEIYKRGYAHGLKDALKDHESEKSYEQGLNDAWECARKIAVEMSIENMQSCGLISNSDEEYEYSCGVIRDYSVSEAIAKIKEYEEKEKFHVGDEIKFEFGGVGLYNAIGVIVRIDDDDYLYVLSGNNDPDYTTIRINPHRDTVHVEKTGRHFPQIEEVLNAMKESINE
jgi:hypothetical protein